VPLLAREQRSAGKAARDRVNVPNLTPGLLYLSCAAIRMPCASVLQTRSNPHTPGCEKFVHGTAHDRLTSQRNSKSTSYATFCHLSFVAAALHVFKRRLPRWRRGGRNTP